MEQNLGGGVHNRVVQQLTGKIPQSRPYGIYNQPPLAEAKQEAGIKEMEVCIGRRQNTVVQYIFARPIMELYLESDRPGGKGRKAVVGAACAEVRGRAGGQGDIGDIRVRYEGGLGGD